MKKSVWPFCRQSVIALICLLAFCPVFFLNIQFNEYKWFAFVILGVCAVFLLKHMFSGFIALYDLLTKSVTTVKGKTKAVVPRENSTFSDRFYNHGKTAADVYFSVTIRTKNRKLVRLKSARYLDMGSYEFVVTKHSGIIVEARGVSS